MRPGNKQESRSLPANSHHAPFNRFDIDQELLRQRAFNLRWATVDEDVIPLTAADPDFLIAPEIRTALKEYTSEGVVGYGPTEGFLGFRSAVAMKLKTRGVDATAEQVLATDGAASALWAACRGVLSPGDEALTFDPVDFLLPHCSEQAGGVVVRCPLESDSGAIPEEAFSQLITDRTKAILVCNPHNPMGRVLRREELLRLGELAIEHDLVLINDEVWSDIILDDVEMISLPSLSPEISDRTITVSGFSKTYGLAGLRIGFIHSSNETLFQKILEMSGAPRTTFGASVLSQVAAEAAIRHCDLWLAGFLEHLRDMRKMAVPRLDALAGFSCRAPEGTYLLYPDIRQTGMTEQQLADRLLDEARVAVVPGLSEWFGPGARGHLRLSFATTEEILDEALGRIEKVIPKG